MEFSGPVFLIFSLVFFMSPVFSYLVSCTRQASLCWVCLWHKTCWIIWFQLINGVSPEKGINELWPLPAACLECAAASQLSGCRLIVSQGSRYCIYVYVYIYCIYCIRETIKPRIAWWQKNKYHYQLKVTHIMSAMCSARIICKYISIQCWACAHQHRHESKPHAVYIPTQLLIY